MVLTAGVAYPIVQLEPVVTGRGDQFFPWANDDYVVYSHWSRSRPNKYTVYATPLAGGTRVQVNAAGTNAADTGGFDPGTNTVIYEQWTNRRLADLFFYNLDTGERSRAPGVNSRFWEWNPVISSRFIAFQRERYRNGAWRESMYVVDRATQERRLLREYRFGDPPWGFLGSVGDRFVTYTFCIRRNCFAYLYDWDTNTTHRVPSVDGKPQYAPVVDEANSALYFSRAENMTCGPNVGIWRLPLDLSGSPTQIVDLPNGIDTGWQSSLTPNSESGHMDLYIERWNCDARTGDIYVARGVDAA